MTDNRRRNTYEDVNDTASKKIMIIDGENVRKVMYMKCKNDTISKMNRIAFTFSIQAVAKTHCTKNRSALIRFGLIICFCTATALLSAELIKAAVIFHLESCHDKTRNAQF